MFEDLFEIERWHFHQFFNCLVDVIWHRVVESRPREPNVVIHHVDRVAQIGTVSHVIEFSEVLLLNPVPDRSEDPCVVLDAESTISGIDLHIDVSFWLFKLIIFLIPEVSVFPLF